MRKILLLTTMLAFPVGIAHAQQWQTQTINGQQYAVLLPPGYDENTQYPVVLYLSQLDMGTNPSAELTQISP